MARIKCVLFFEDELSHDFTETYYVINDSPAGALLRFDPKNPDSFLIKRLNVLAKNFYCTEVRAGNDEQDRDSLIIPLSFTDGKGRYPGTAEGEQAWDSLLLRCEAGALHRRAFKLAGIPRGVISSNGSYSPTPQWITKFDLFADSMKTFLQAQIRTQTAGVRVHPALSILGDNRSLGLSFVPGATPAGWTVGKYVKLTRYTGSNAINGQWRIRTANAADVVTFPRRTDMFGNPLMTGDAQLITIDAAPITAVLPLRGARRKTARPTAA